MKLFIPLLIACLLSGCASSPNQINYYVLENASDTAKTQPETARNKTILLDNLQLASYLQSTNLPILKHDYTVSYARQSAWAEPIEHGIKRALVNDFNSVSKQQLILDTMPNSSRSDYQLHIQIDHFVPTDNAEVILVGQYWLNQGDTLLSHQAINLKQPLVQDGFSESVQQQRKLLKQLTQLVAQDPALNHVQ
jgi:uncharacterized lipoprotein YmbA